MVNVIPTEITIGLNILKPFNFSFILKKNVVNLGQDKYAFLFRSNFFIF